MAKKRYVVVGTGNRSSMYIQAAAQTFRDQAELVGLCDINPERLNYYTRFLAEECGNHPPVPVFTADRFDSPASDVEQRAKSRMMNTAYSSARNQCAGYSSVSEKGGNIRAQVKARYLLLPVYLFDIVQGGKNYSFAVNGQSGKVVGQLPNDKPYNFRYFMIRAGAAFSAFMLYSIARYFMGA